MNKTNKIILVIVVVVAAIGLIFWGTTHNNRSQIAKGADLVKIGLVGHFSGEYASYGIPMKNAVELAVEKFNQENNKLKVSLIVEDDKTNANDAASAVNKLINVDNVNYIISAQGSGVTAAIGPIAQNNKRILMITLGSAPNLTKVGEYVFRSVPSDVYQANKMVEFINNNFKSKKIAVLYINDAYGNGIYDIVNQNFNSKVVSAESFTDGDTDFKTQLVKIKTSGADTLVLVSKNETPQILKQLKELDLKLNIVASETVKDEKLLNNSGEAAEGIYIVFMAEPKDYIDFKNAYKNKFSEEPSAYSMYAYDGAIALLDAIKINPSAEKIKSNLLSAKFRGASGEFGLDNDRERIGMEYIIYIVRAGKAVEYKK
jgi:branched-chain amino acid transport system substrate-binding protein